MNSRRLGYLKATYLLLLISLFLMGIFRAVAFLRNIVLFANFANITCAHFYLWKKTETRLISDSFRILGCFWLAEIVVFVLTWPNLFLDESNLITTILVFLNGIFLGIIAIYVSISFTRQKPFWYVYENRGLINVILGSLGITLTTTIVALIAGMGLHLILLLKGG